MINRTKYLFVISFDGLSTLDFEFISSLPNFKEFMKSTSYCKNVCSIYPSLTYPAHATIVTGKYPKNHGIIDNKLLQPNRESPDWYWERKYVQGETIYDLAIDRGMETAALLWPVTAKSKIKYNMPEIFANRPWHNQALVSLFNGSPLYQLEMNKKFGHLRKGLNQPELDNFTHAALIETIITKRPEMTLVHYTDLDSKRHRFGFGSKEAFESLKRLDKRLGDIIKTLKEEGMYDKSTLIVLGDHSSLDESRAVCLNILLREKGYIKANDKGKVISYRAILKPCDGSAYIYLKDKRDTKLIRKLLEEFNKEHNCIESILTGAQAGELGADPNCDFMLEAKIGYYFSGTLHGEIIREIETNSEGRAINGTKATHGYSPQKKDYTTMFFASGRGIRRGVEIKKMNLIDEGPTIAYLLGFELKDADGRILYEIID